MVMRRYYGEIDFMRAILIILVILVHIVHWGGLYPEVKAGILSFMMPAFLFITGFLVNVRKNVKEFGLYVLRIALPYVIMVTGYMVVSLYLPVNDGIRTFDAATVCRVLFVTSIGPYWFLRVMIVCGILYYASFNVLKHLSNEAKLCIFAVLIILLSQLTPLLEIKSAVYYFLGVVAKIFIGDFTKVYRSSLWFALPFALLIVNKDFWDWGTLSVLICVYCFISFSAGLYERMERAYFMKVIVYIGRNTLPIISSTRYSRWHRNSLSLYSHSILRESCMLFLRLRYVW